MHRQIVLTHDPIEEAGLVRQRRALSQMGAVISFVGVVRDREGEHLIQALEYEAYVRMAQHQFEIILLELEKRWPIDSVRLVHRLGRVKVGEVSLWVEVIGPHRGEAFAACQFLIDEMKRLVPIWKRSVLVPA